MCELIRRLELDRIAHDMGDATTPQLGAKGQIQVAAAGLAQDPPAKFVQQAYVADPLLTFFV